LNRGLLAFAGLLVAGATVTGVYVALPGGGEEEVVQQAATATPGADVVGTPVSTATPFAGSPTPARRTPSAGETLWRWGNVTILIREDSGISVSRYVAPPQRNPPDGGPEMDLILGDSQVGINAVIGSINFSAVGEAHKSIFDEALATLEVDPADTLAMDWPPSEGLSPDSPTLQWGRIKYTEPPPDTGVVVVGTIGDCSSTDCANIDNRFIQISTGSFTTFVTVRDGQLTSDVLAAPEGAQAALARYIKTMVLCGSEEPC
jgi:hypothetical protein